MAKVLVIRGANFSENALDQVELENPVPCESISIPATQTIKYLGDTATLTATVLPSDTTDAVFWESSDPTIVSVRNGVLTSHKAGTVTITATCGEKSATCAVTAQNYIDAKLTYSWYYNRSGAQKPGEENKYTPRVSGGPQTMTYGGTYNATPTPNANSPHALDYDTLVPGINLYPVMIPDGAVKISITMPNQLIKSSFSWTNSDDSCYWNGTEGVYIAEPAWEGTPWSDTALAGTRTVTIPSGVDSFYISMYAKAADVVMTQAICDAVEVRALYE